MKKITLLFLFLIIAAVSNGQTTLAAQDFEGAGSDNWSYTATPSAYSEAGDTDIWIISTSVGSISSAQNTTSFWGIRDIENSGSGGTTEHTLAFANIDVSGQTDLLVSFYYNAVGYENSDYLRIEFFFDNISQGEEELSKNTSNWELYSKAIPNGTSQVRFTFKAKQNGGSDYGGLDNIKLESGANTNPSLTIDSPAEGANIPVNSNGIDINFSMLNYTVSGDNGSGTSDNSGDGYITYTIDSGSAVNKFDTNTINLTGLSDGAHTVLINLVDNNGNPIMPATSSTVNFSTFNTVQSLPLNEQFDYNTGQNLGDQNNWSNNNSGDEVLITSGSLTYPGLDSNTGNSVSFDGSGTDPSIEFTETSSGAIYSSFIFRITDVANFTNVDGGYFAVLQNISGGFESRIWLKPSTTTNDFVIGISTGSTATQFTTTTYSIDTDIFIVFNYDLSSGTTNLWVNTDTGISEPIALLSETEMTAATSLSKFLIRQDSSSETPSMIIDELKIGTSWTDVTAQTLNTVDFITENNKFKTYPNPITNGIINFSGINDQTEIKIINALGEQVYNKKLTSNNLNVSNLSPGIYFVQLFESINKIGIQKIIIK